MIILDEKTLALWNVPLPDRSDWLAAVRELVPDEKYQLDYRFRYYADDKVFESEDKKSWYTAQLSGTRHYVLESTRAIARRMASEAGSKVSEYLNDGDMKAFMEKIGNAPSIYMRRT
jgi:hypothetical protein